MEWIDTVVSFLRDNQSTILSGVCGAIFLVPATLYVEHRKAKREERIEQKKQKNLAFDNRPEMEIVGYDENLSCPDHVVQETVT